MLIIDQGLQEMSWGEGQTVGVSFHNIMSLLDQENPSQSLTLAFINSQRPSIICQGQKVEKSLRNRTTACCSWLPFGHKRTQEPGFRSRRLGVANESVVQTPCGLRSKSNHEKVLDWLWTQLQCLNSQCSRGGNDWEARNGIWVMTLLLLSHFLQSSSSLPGSLFLVINRVCKDLKH